MQTAKQLGLLFLYAHDMHYTRITESHDRTRPFTRFASANFLSIIAPLSRPLVGKSILDEWLPQSWPPNLREMKKQGVWIPQAFRQPGLATIPGRNA
jgi:hypothetical protein